MKKGKMKLFLSLLIVLATVSFVGCGNKTVQNNNVQTVDISDFENESSERMSKYLTEKSEELLSEIDGVETVKAIVNYNETTDKYMIDVEYSISEGNEDKSEDIKELMQEILTKTFEFESINFK